MLYIHVNDQIRLIYSRMNLLFMLVLEGRAERGAGVLPGLLPGELLQPLHPALVSVPPLLAPLPSRSQARGANNLLWI